MNPIIKKGIVALFFRFFGALLNFLLSVYIARYLVKGDYGTYQFFLTLITGGSLFPRVGMDTYLMSKIPGERVKRKQTYILKNAVFLVFFLSFILSLLVFSSYLTYLYFYHKPLQIKMTFLVCASLLPYSNYMLISSIEKAKEHINKSLFISNMLPPLLMYLSMQISIHDIDKLNNTISSYLASSSLVFLIALLFLIKDEKRIFSVNNIHFYHLFVFFKRSRKYILHSLTAYLLLFVDLIIIGIFLSREYTADYSVASRVTLIIILAMSVYDGIASPIIIKSYKTLSSNEFIKKISKIFLVTISFISFFVAFMIVFSELIIPMFGNEYNDSIQISHILIAAYGIKGLGSLPGYVLIAMNKVHYINKILIISLLINIVMSYYLMQYYSITGVAIGTLISSIIVVVFSYYAMLKNFKVIKIAL